MQLFSQTLRNTGAARQAAHDELVLAHLNIAESIARRYSAPGQDPADIRQVAYLGLVKAVRRFDPDTGNAFPAYAVPTVTGEVKRYLRDHAGMMRAPRSVHTLRPRVWTTRAELAQALGRDPSAGEIATAMDMDTAEVQEALDAQRKAYPESLDTPAADSDGRPITEMLGSADGNLERLEELLTLASALRGLTDVEKRVLFLRFFREQSQQKIGEETGMTQMQVSRMLNRLLQRLRGQLGPDR
jgi:RNA polymerase sigma-B factor